MAIYLTLSATAHARTHAPHRVRGALHTHTHTGRRSVTFIILLCVFSCYECVFGSPCSTAAAVAVCATRREKENYNDGFVAGIRLILPRRELRVFARHPGSSCRGRRVSRPFGRPHGVSGSSSAAAGTTRTAGEYTNGDAVVLCYRRLLSRLRSCQEATRGSVTNQRKIGAG